MPMMVMMLDMPRERSHTSTNPLHHLPATVASYTADVICRTFSSKESYIPDDVYVRNHLFMVSLKVVE